MVPAIANKENNSFGHLSFCQFLPPGISASWFKPVKTGGKDQFLPPPANPGIRHAVPHFSPDTIYICLLVTDTVFRLTHRQATTDSVQNDLHPDGSWACCQTGDRHQGKQIVLPSTMGNIAVHLVDGEDVLLSYGIMKITIDPANIDEAKGGAFCNVVCT